MLGAYSKYVTLATREEIFLTRCGIIDRAQIMDLVPSTAKQCLVLVTSRKNLPLEEELGTDMALSIHLKPLSTVQAAALLRRIWWVLAQLCPAA